MDEMRRITHKIQIDAPDSRDYSFDELCGSIHLQKIDKLPDFTIFRQVGNPCTFFAAVTVSNIQNLIEYGRSWRKYQEINPDVYRKERTAIHPEAIQEGDTLQNAMKFLKAKKLIQWYTKISETRESIEKAVSYWFMCYTAMQRLDWSRTRDSGVVVPAQDYCFGHAVEWAKLHNDEAPELTWRGVRFPNTFWPERGKYHGWFLAERKYLLERDICSKYAIIDFDNQLSPVFDAMEKKVAMKSLYDKIISIEKYIISPETQKELNDVKLILVKHWFTT